LKDYLLHTLSPEDFEDLIVQICLRVLGTGTICFSKGRDGGRDAKFVGKANQFPSGKSPWTGQFVVQAKSTSNPIASCSDPDFLRTLRDEVPRVCALRAAGECDNYILFTNRKLTAQKEEELTEYLRSETSVSNIAILGREAITSYLTKEPSIAEQFHLVTRSRLPSLHQIPPPVGDFTGRHILLDEIKTAITTETVNIVGLSGMGGVGKTALALKLAEVLKQNYPDGQLLIDLKGFESRRLSSKEVISKVIRSFHPEAIIPDSEDERRGLFYSVLEKKRVLLLLDNATDAAQIHSLVPPSDCLLLITSRQRIILPGCLGKSVEELTLNEACSLLLNIAPRISEEASVIAKLCGYLPLALRLAGGVLAERPNLAPQRYAERLKDKQRRLELVDASIDISYSYLDEDLKQKWNMLSVFSGSFDGSAVAAVWDLDEEEVESALSELIRSSMIIWGESGRRYKLHDLLRLFGDKCLVESSRLQANKNHARYYSILLARAAIADKDESREAWALGLATRIYAQVIYDSEWDDIKAGYDWAKSHMLEDPEAALTCTNYAIAGVLLHKRRKDLLTLEEWINTGLQAAQILDDRERQAAILRELALLYSSQDRLQDGIKIAEECQELSHQDGNVRIERDSFGILAICYKKLGQKTRAKEFEEKYLDKAYESGDWDLLNENPVEVDDKPDSPEEHFKNLLTLPDPFLLLLAGDKSPHLAFIAIIYVGLGKYEKARLCCVRGLNIARQMGAKKIQGRFSFLIKKIDAAVKKLNSKQDKKR
jgi:tetratricopeptide (TPR) repeat protein